MARFNDHFSDVAEGYATYRPTYPQALYSYLVSFCMKPNVAWDCATGSGQAAIGLARYFKEVIATDASAAQIANATAAPNVSYRIAKAENSGIDTDSVDLVATAQALHWFDLAKFYQEVRRVLRPGGVLAVWTYGLAQVDPGVDEVVHRLYEDIVGPYWPPERDRVADGYHGLPFPFDEVETPMFRMTSSWSLAQMCGYLRTWSAVKRYRDANGNDPVAAIADELAAEWGDCRRTVAWSLALRVGRC